jgi:hypothetical protein
MYLIQVVLHLEMQMDMLQYILRMFYTEIGEMVATTAGIDA